MKSFSLIIACLFIFPTIGYSQSPGSFSSVRVNDGTTLHKGTLEFGVADVVFQNNPDNTNYGNLLVKVWNAGSYTNSMFLKHNGSVGIGTTTPNEKLELRGNLRIGGPNNTNSSHSELSFYRGDGARFASIGQASLTLGNSTFDIVHYNGNDIRILNNSVNEIIRFKANGDVSIGTQDPKGYKLAVAGKVIAEEIVVKLQTNWPDYVFSGSYKLPKLSELEEYILLNKHLPGIPSADEVKQDGVPLGEMQSHLLEKIEELTLYMIEQNKKIELLEKELVKLSTRK